jgi:hypothetical protein
MHVSTCLGFHVECGTMFKGIGVTVMAFILFIGSVYLLLSAILGRWMAYLLVIVTFAGWLAVLSVMWLTGFFISQGVPSNTPRNTGPQGQLPVWVPLSAGAQDPTGLDPKYSAFTKFPERPWTEITDPSDPQVQAAESVAQAFLAKEANAAHGIYDQFALNAVTTSQFMVDHVAFATAADGKTQLAVVVAHFASGGPRTVVAMYYDLGSVQRYGVMFLVFALLLLVTHLPLLDKAEKRRKAFLTGGAAPAWYGPA